MNTASQYFDQHPFVRAVSYTAMTVSLFNAAGCSIDPSASPDQSPSLSAGATTRPLATPQRSVFNDLRDPAKQDIARRLVACVEYDSSVLHYGNVEVDDDNRGITAGIDGFTSGTSDMLEVVTELQDLEPDNTLKPFLKPLERIDAAQKNGKNPSIAGLERLPATWKKAAVHDAFFRKAQRTIDLREYMTPALKLAEDKGLTTAAEQAAIYDAEIQHGPGPDKDGVPALARRADMTFGGKHVTGMRWLKAFTDARKQDLLHPHDPSNIPDWPASVDRARAFYQLAKNNTAFTLPMHFYADQTHYTLLPTTK